MKQLLILLIITFLGLCNSYGQGIIRGKVTDENGEALIGATIALTAQRTTGTVADYDGNYTLKIDESSPQTIVVAFIGYQPVVDTVNPQKGEVLIRNFDMVPLSNEIEEVKIVAKAPKAKESYMTRLKIKSVSSIDYISGEIIKRTGDASVSSAVTRITGVSTYGGFITVRGIGDRYVKTTINGSRIPTLDPFTNNIKLDMFPASLVDNIVITKTVSADLPGDWCGAFLNVETKDYPEKFTVNVETSAGYNSQCTFNSIVSSNRSTTDWLGYDNGFRTIRNEKPAYYDLNYFKYQEFSALGLADFFNSIGVTANTPWNDTYTRLALVELHFLGKAEINNYEAYKDALSRYNNSDLKQQGLQAATADVVKMGRSLPNNWLTINRRAPVDFSLSFSIGNQKQFLRKPLGFIIGFRYSGSTQYDKNSTYGRTDYEVNNVTSLDNPYEIYHTYGWSKNSIETNGWSALFNASYKLRPNHSISFLIMPNFMGVNKARNDFSYSNKTGSGIDFCRISQFYEARRQIVYQLKTEHYFSALKMKIEWNTSFTDANSNSPDFRQLNYIVDPNSRDITRILTLSQESGNFRVFRTLSENLIDSRLSAELPLGEKADLPRRIKFGGSWQTLIRRADQHFYILPPNATSDNVVNNDLEAYMSLDNFNFVDGRVKRYYWQLAGPENNTIGFSKIQACFVMVDYSVVPAMRIYAGIRAEDHHLHTDILDLYNRQLAENDDRRLGIKPGFVDNIFWMPSASIIYQLNRDKQAPINIRFNYSQSVALPSLREITPFRVYDYTLLGVVTGNTDLKPVKIKNYDLRGEAYFNSGDNISLSLFYKKFLNHIEMVREELEDVYYYWQNADNSYTMGIELEGRIGITKNLEIRTNATLVKSETSLKKDSESRSMFGQAPYIVNAILAYSSDKIGLTTSLSYNVQGPKLVITGTFDQPDIYELTRHVIDAKFTKKLSKYFTASFRIRDLLNMPIRRAYKFPAAGWLDFDKYTYGTTYLFGISYNLN
jgi:outer membrane receptor protein involved in Fe transport